MKVRLAITADLHWGIRPAGDAATGAMLAFLQQQPPDVLVLAGDIGAGEHFDQCLELFRHLPCRKALVPGNHDIWVAADDARGDSLRVYRDYLSASAARNDFHYLDHGALFLPEAGLAIAGTMNWYDYSWSLDTLKQKYPDELDRLETKHFTRGRHNDANFVRWPLDDIQFTQQVTAAFADHLQTALQAFQHVLVVTHHPAFHGLSFPRPEQPPSLDGLLWDAFSGNRTLEELLRAHADRIPFVFSGHTHRARENMLGPIRGYNIGGDYHFKRLLLLHWPAAAITHHEFGIP
jgi:3',5'-cyclic AMP phosphodiesterase CpdA